MNENSKGKVFRLAIILLIALANLPVQLTAQEIPGELVFEEPFEGEELVPGWYMVQNNNATAELLGMIEAGPNGGNALVVLTYTPDNVALTNLQFSNEAFARPEGSDLYEWRVTFWIRTQVVPFTIRPIIAMSEDPWTGTDVDVPIENANEWTYVDVVLPRGDFLTSDPLLYIMHMGNPGDENGENEVWFDDLKIYLLNKETKIGEWEMY
ncbi:MAG: hypothetical protein AB1656_21555 [Candidatus Omnitrophota bacterium]